MLFFSLSQSKFRWSKRWISSRTASNRGTRFRKKRRELFPREASPFSRFVLSLLSPKIFLRAAPSFIVSRSVTTQVLSLYLHVTRTPRKTQSRKMSFQPATLYLFNPPTRKFNRRNLARRTRIVLRRENSSAPFSVHPRSQRNTIPYIRSCRFRTFKCTSK